MEKQKMEANKVQVMNMNDIKAYWDSLTNAEKKLLRMHIHEYEEEQRRAYKA